MNIRCHEDLEVVVSWGYTFTREPLSVSASLTLSDKFNFVQALWRHQKQSEPNKLFINGCMEVIYIPGYHQFGEVIDVVSQKGSITMGSGSHALDTPVTDLCIVYR
ncbi:hypothetical protein TNCV_3208541 [Trichonephila clavipes]|nr:hypothetical protein TNCV_3208541 [Trichonephila clavipes]